MVIEDCQRQFTRIFEGMGLLPYHQRLQRLRLTTLLERRRLGEGGVRGVWKPQNRTEIRQKTANRIGFLPEYRNREYK